MALLKEAKTELIKQYRQHETDSGSPEVQVAVLTNRITYLTEHFNCVYHRVSSGYAPQMPTERDSSDVGHSSLCQCSPVRLLPAVAPPARRRDGILLSDA